MKLSIYAERRLFMNLYVWGTGCGAGQAIEKGLPPDSITAFVDSYPVLNTFLGKPVLPPEALKDCTLDLLIVTTRHVEQVAMQCRELQIPEDKILYLKNSCRLIDRNASCTAARKILGKKLLKSLLPGQYLVTQPDSLSDPVLEPENDYVRLSTLELLCRQLSPVPGAMAELGVYKGGFAACMNKLCPDRRLYLFDSFQGFQPEEAQQEKGRGTCTDGFLTAHQNTSVQSVLDHMPHPENVILKIGFFPDSLHGLEDRFSLVSLDADFRDSTLEGLRYFWPRLNAGGYLMLHDWGSPRLSGVRQALELYRTEIEEPIASVPIPDLGSSLILQKL